MKFLDIYNHNKNIRFSSFKFALLEAEKRKLKTNILGFYLNHPSLDAAVQGVPQPHGGLRCARSLRVGVPTRVRGLGKLRSTVLASRESCLTERRSCSRRTEFP